MIPVCTLLELSEKSQVVVRGSDRPIVVFYNAGKPVAVDNRCPHMGFPLHRGMCQNGIVTCHWHHARFDGCSGGAYDLFAGDVEPYEVQVRDGMVLVSPEPRKRDAGEYHRRRLHEGMERASSLMIAKAILALRSAGVPDTDIVREAILFGAQHRDDWANGATILSAMANLLPDLSEETAYLALLHGVSQVADNAQGQAPHRRRYALETDAIPLDQLDRLFASWSEKRHRDAAERTLLTAIACNADQVELTRIIFGAATDRMYPQTGHVIDFCNKAFEALNHIGWRHAQAVLPSLVGSLVSSRGQEELDTWRHPIDLTELLRKATDRMMAMSLSAPVNAPPETSGTAGSRAADGGVSLTRRVMETDLPRQLLGDDPAAILDALLAAMQRGLSTPEIGAAVCYAAAMRLARFATSNEISDWITALHTFSYCNAMHRAIIRCPKEPRLFRGLLHGAMSIYQDRFLNVPPAKLPTDTPGSSSALEALSSDGPSLLREFLDALDSQQQTDRAAQLVARYLQRRQPLGPLIDTLAKAVLREDANFHTYQMLEAGIRQYRLWGDTPQGHHILIAVARYLAAHSPTQRSLMQTANIALRLHRGEKIYEEE